MGFINKFIDEKVGQIFKKFVPKYNLRDPIIPHSQNVSDFKNSCVNIDSKTFLHLNCDNYSLYLISRNKNNDLILEKEVKLYIGPCHWNIVAVDKIKNHLILGKNYYKDYGWYQYRDDGEYYNYLYNLLFYDLNNFSEINHIILKDRKVINKVFNNNYCDIIGLFNPNLKKNIFYCSFPPIKIYLVSLKNCRIRTFHNTVDFKENEITEEIRPQRVFFLDYSQIIIVQFWKKKTSYFLLIYKYENDEVRYISRKYLGEKGKRIDDMKEIDKNGNLIILSDDEVLFSNCKNLYENETEISYVHYKFLYEDGQEEEKQDLEKEINDYYSGFAEVKHNKKCKKYKDKKSKKK